MTGRRMHGRTLAQEVADLAVLFEDGGYKEGAARRLAEKITAAIGAHYYMKGFRDGQSAQPRPTTLEELLEEEGP
jgi:hypothetical protein